MHLNPLDHLPTYEAAAALINVAKQTPNPLEKFIYDHQPQDSVVKVIWRYELIELIEALTGVRLLD